MANELGAAGLQAGGSFLGALGSGLFNLLGAKRQFKYSQELAKQQNQYNIDMWRLNNEYNTPEAQMKRFQEAGLSPQLMYSQGNAGNSSSAPEMVTPGPPNIQAGYSSIGKAFDVLSLISQIQKVKQNSEVLQQEQLKTFMNSLSMKDYLAQMEAKTRMFTPHSDNEVIVNTWTDGKRYFRPIEELSRYYLNSLENQYTVGRGKAQEWKYRGNLSNLGMNVRDPYYARLWVTNMPDSTHALQRIAGNVDTLLTRMTDWVNRPLFGLSHGNFNFFNR